MLSNTTMKNQSRLITILVIIPEKFKKFLGFFDIFTRSDDQLMIYTNCYESVIAWKHSTMKVLPNETQTEVQ
jgi:hypothetical protein